MPNSNQTSPIATAVRLTQFLQAETKRGPALQVVLPLLYGRYKRYAAEQNIAPVDLVEFEAFLQSHGYQIKRPIVEGFAARVVGLELLPKS